MADATAKRALIVAGGWAGHEPQASAEIFAGVLRADGYAVTMSDTLDAWLDKEALAATDLVVPIFTMSTITPEQPRSYTASAAYCCRWRLVPVHTCEHGRGDGARVQASFAVRRSLPWSAARWKRATSSALLRDTPT